MVRIGTPIDEYNYIKINNDEYIYILAKNNYMPKYKNNEFVYFKKTDDLIKFMEKEGFLYV